ncbi:2-isopropylmalate synthase [Stylonychia lemnae]|uniref:2-isopropylmalate synthase n=1 Tax=Stylonychia lemnae TaxID=5949 RepID=A0A078AZN0_STYLE|nr:2-isopropylmalate synthase [Stylonychia lemnae]|eukprot:CDW87649.1 2-isopropylmalate synthase [Stylonychia lemnae]
MSRQQEDEPYHMLANDKRLIEQSTCYPIIYLAEQNIPSGQVIFTQLVGHVQIKELQNILRLQISIVLEILSNSAEYKFQWSANMLKNYQVQKNQHSQPFVSTQSEIFDSSKLNFLYFETHLKYKKGSFMHKMSDLINHQIFFFDLETDKTYAQKGFESTFELFMFNNCLMRAQKNLTNLTFIPQNLLLNNGEQSPGVALNLKQKLEIATQLSRMNVDVCESGFPVASKGEFEAVKAIAQQVGPLKQGRNKPMIITGLSRAIKEDIIQCYEAVKEAPLHRIHTFLATSDIHLKHKLKITRDQCLENVYKGVKFASSLVEDVQFSAEDASRSDPNFLVQVCQEAIKAGASTINICDTVGYTTPIEYQQLIHFLINKIPDGDQVVWSTHCHNDLGLATANTLAGIQGGARQVEVTVNGIGERAGNAALEEVIMAIRTRPKLFPINVDHFISSEIIEASRLVSAQTGILVQANKAIVGANAFAHESGIHQDGLIKHAGTYEIMSPESIGLPKRLIVIGKHSGKAGLKQCVNDLGYNNLSENQIQELLTKLKIIANEKKEITHADIETLINAEFENIKRQ